MKRILLVRLVILGLSLLAAGCQSVTQDTSLKGSPPAMVPEGVDINSKPSEAPAEPPVSPSHAFTSLTFAKDYDAGTKDANSQLMGGTETMLFLQHQGMLFASTGAVSLSTVRLSVGQARR